MLSNSSRISSCRSDLKFAASMIQICLMIAMALSVIISPNYFGLSIFKCGCKSVRAEIFLLFSRVGKVFLQGEEEKKSAQNVILKSF